MRRKYFGWAIAAIATLGPIQAWAGDHEIAEQIIERLKVDRDSGTLKEFTLDMQVDQGVVVFRGNVSKPSQKELLLRAANGVEGVIKVVDEVEVTSGSNAGAPITGETIEGAPIAGAVDGSGFSFREALAAQAESIRTSVDEALPTQIDSISPKQEVVPGQVLPTGAAEPVHSASNANEQAVTSAVVGALRDAQLRGELRGFGVDVRNRQGVVELVGQAGSAAQRNLIVRIAEKTPGVKAVHDSITIAQAQPEIAQASDTMPRLQQPPVLEQLAPVTVEAAPVSARNQAGPVSAMAAPYRMQGQQMAQPVSSPMQGAPMMGQPVPMGGYGGGVGAPRYDSPYLPNYAWPGYAAYPNYAAVTYPQQYSPSAFPYIGPFYPYPQVPLGWRKVSLEWDDGWWFLDFSDR